MKETLVWTAIILSFIIGVPVLIHNYHVNADLKLKEALNKGEMIRCGAFSTPVVLKTGWKIQGEHVFNHKDVFELSQSCVRPD